MFSTTTSALRASRVVILSFELIPGSAIRASAVSVRMAGALRKAGEVAAKLRRLSAALLAVRLFSAPLGLLVLFGPRKERTPRYGSMFRIHAP